MKKERISFDDFVYSDDYKLEYAERRTHRSIASREKWLYLGADSKDKTFAKIGLTMGDLGSRSYSSARPTFFLFCAFKCDDDISKEKLEAIEDNILYKFERAYRRPDGSTARERHFESGRWSECFSPVDFEDFFSHLHYELLNTHRSGFVICDLVGEFDEVIGEYVDCIFNAQLPPGVRERYVKMIAQ